MWESNFPRFTPDAISFFSLLIDSSICYHWNALHQTDQTNDMYTTPSDSMFFVKWFAYARSSCFQCNNCGAHTPWGLASNQKMDLFSLDPKPCLSGMVPHTMLSWTQTVGYTRLVCSGSQSYTPSSFHFLCRMFQRNMLRLPTAHNTCCAALTI